jgi:iron-sulfur cluster assembly accessory protein
MQIPTLTETAAQHINKICEEYAVYAVTLNLKGGGCAGFEYKWGTAEEQEIEDTDVVIDTGSGNFVINEFSMPFLEGTEIDYVTEMMSSKLVVRNPNVQASCGCGESIGF